MAESYSTIGELTAAVKLVARIRGTSNVTHLLIEGDHWTTLRTVEVLEVMKGDQALVGTTFEAIQDGRADMPNTMAEEDFPFIEAGSEYVIFGNGGPSKTEPTRLHFGPWGLFKVSGSSLTDLDPLSQLPAAQQTLQIPELRAAVAGGH